MHLAWSIVCVFITIDLYTWSLSISYGNALLSVCGSRVDVHVILNCLFFGINTARSCHLSVVRMHQTDELATKRVFGVIMFLITDCIFSCRLTAFSPVAGYHILLLFFYRS